MRLAGKALHAIINDFVVIRAVIKIAMKYANSGVINHHDITHANAKSSIEPITNKAGNVCTSLSDSGYNSFKVMRDIPKTYT